MFPHEMGPMALLRMMKGTVQCGYIVFRKGQGHMHKKALVLKKEQLVGLKLSKILSGLQGTIKKIEQIYHQKSDTEDY